MSLLPVHEVRALMKNRIQEQAQSEFEATETLHVYKEDEVCGERRSIGKIETRSD